MKLGVILSGSCNISVSEQLSSFSEGRNMPLLVAIEFVFFSDCKAASLDPTSRRAVPLRSSISWVGDREFAESSGNSSSSFFRVNSKTVKLVSQFF